MRRFAVLLLAALSATSLLAPGAHAMAATAARLAWAPPALTDPTTIVVTPDNRILHLADDQDYIIKMPTVALAGAGGLSISGGHDVVLIGGRIDISGLGAAGVGNAGRGLVLAGQTGTVHIEGLRLSGDSLDEGIDLSEGHGAVVQLENVRIDGLSSPEAPTFTSFHPDLVQSWAGPARLRVDHFTGYTDYQGFFLAPQSSPTTPLPLSFDLRNVQVIGDATSAFLMWRTASIPTTLDNVWVTSNAGRAAWQSFYPNQAAWPGASFGPSGGDVVPIYRAGDRYTSPGYLDPPAPAAAASARGARPR